MTERCHFEIYSNYFADCESVCDLTVYARTRREYETCCDKDKCPIWQTYLSSKQTKKIIPFRKQGKTRVNKMCDEFKQIQKLK